MDTQNLKTIQFHMKQLNNDFYDNKLRYIHLYRVSVLMKKYYAEIKYNREDRHRRRIAMLLLMAFDRNILFNMSPTQHAYLVTIIAKLFKVNCTHDDVLRSVSILESGGIDWVIGSKQSIRSFTK